MRNVQNNREDKRKGPDVLTQILSGSSTAGGILLILVAVLVFIAKPDARIAMYPNHSDAGLWQKDIAEVLPYLFGIGLVLSTVGLWINSKRLRREGDSVKFSLLFLWIISVLVCVLYSVI